MPLPIPNLDDRTWEELVEEAVRRIPVYAPEWTDHNIHDPGITLIELFAWLTEMQLYRLNRIADRHYLKYLKMLGIRRPQPASPARVDVTFSLEKLSDSIVNVEKQSKVITGDTATGVTFETDEEIDVLPVELKRVVSFSNFQFSEVTDFNKPNHSFYNAFGEKANTGCALYLGFDFEKATIAGQEMKLNVYLYEEDLPPAGQHGNEIAQVYPSADVLWEYYAESDKWVELEPVPPVNKLVKTLCSSGRISFIVPSDTAKSKVSDIDEELFWLKCRVKEEGYEIPPRIDRITLNTVPAVQGITVDQKGLGSSSGLPQQSFETDHSPIIAGTQVVTIAGEEWHEVDDFDASGPEDNHYTIDRQNGKITFGDGIRGRVPPKEKEIFISYRYGGGKEGNILANTITRAYNKAGDSLGVEVTNHFPATGGKEKETIQEAILRARTELKIPFRAVTAEDFEFIALATPGLRVARAKAKVTSKNEVTVVVVPHSPLERAIPSAGFIKTVCQHIDMHRLITTNIEVDKPNYVPVSINTSIKSKPGASSTVVRARVEQAIDDFLSPLKGGPDGTGWPFGRSVYRSEVYAVIDEVEGVDCVSRLSISGSTGDRKIGDLDLVYPGTHNIEITEPDTACKETGYE